MSAYSAILFRCFDRYPAWRARKYVCPSRVCDKRLLQIGRWNGHLRKPVPVNTRILSTDRSGLSSFYYYYLFTLRFFLISFIARLLYSVLMCIRGSTVFEDRFRHARTKISIEPCLFILPEFTLDETRWRDRETMVWPIFFYIDFKVGLPIFFRYVKFHHFTFQIDLVYALQITLLFGFRKKSVEF